MPPKSVTGGRGVLRGVPVPAGTDGSELPSFSTRSTTVNVQEGAIVVHAARGQSPEEIARATVIELHRMAMAQTGDTLQIPIF